MFRLLRFRIILVVTGIIVATTLAIMMLVQKETTEAFQQSEERQAQNLLNSIALNIENQYKSLVFHQTTVLDQRKSELRNVVGIVVDLLEGIDSQIEAGKLSKEDAQRYALHEVQRLRWDDGVGYIWINDMGKPYPRMLMHPTMPELDGTILDDPKFNCALGAEKNLFQAAVEVCEKNKSGYIDYLWPKPVPGGLTEEQPKISYVKLFEEWGWVVGSGVYIDDIQEESSKRLEAIVSELNASFSKVRIGKSGYVFLFNGDKELLIHPAIDKNDFRVLKNPTTENLIFDDLVEAAKTQGKSIKYIWDKPPDHLGEYRFWKKAYVHHFEPLDWYLATSVYIDEMALPAKTLRVKIVYLTVVFVTIAFLVSLLLSSTLTRPLQKLMGAVSTIKEKGLFSADIPVSGTQETRDLGTTLREMVRSIGEAHQALYEREETFRALTENSVDTIMRFDRDHRYLYVNPAAEHQMGIPATQCIGKTHKELGFSQELVQLWDNSLEKVFVTGEIDRIEFKLPTGRWIDWISVPERDVNGDVKAVITSARDITDSKLAEEEKEKLEDQLRQSQKMEAVGQLAGGVAHDFNNLLQAILGYSEFALEEAEEGSVLHKELSEVMKAATRATTLVGQLLAFSRRQVLQLKDLDLNVIVDELAKMIRRVIGETITLKVHFCSGVAAIRADRGQIEQVLMNLCINARDAMPDGGGITLETLIQYLDEDFCTLNTWAKPGRFVVLSVSDTGEGMDNDTLEHVFEPFFTTKATGRGTGLGLSTVYGIVQQHQGMIHVYSEKGFGTKFRIYFPMNKPANDMKEETIEPARGGTETILMAEDDHVVRGIASRILASAGYTVLTAQDGEEALEVFHTHEQEIDLILLDMVMPNLGGRQVCDHIHKTHPDIPILFASGYSTDALQKNFILKEDMQLIQKPYHRDDLLRKIREMLDA